MLIPRWVQRGIILVLLAFLVTSTPSDRWKASYSQETKPGTDENPKPETTSKQLEEMKREAAEYRITLDSSPPRVLTLKKEPALHWTNPLRQTNDGAVFIWVSDGRPEVVASFYQFRREGVLAEDHEFQSVSFTTLTASREGRDIWIPTSPGITLTAFPNAPAPASSPDGRLRQMRSMARELKAFIDFKKDPTELRLLTKPLYRYESQRPELVDGALFAFVQTTDPEVLLLLEARPVEGALAWHYGIARMSMVNLRVEHKDQVIWQVPWNTEANSPDKTSLTIPAPRQPVSDDAPKEEGKR